MTYDKTNDGISAIGLTRRCGMDEREKRAEYARRTQPAGMHREDAQPAVTSRRRRKFKHPVE